MPKCSIPAPRADNLVCSFPKQQCYAWPGRGRCQVARALCCEQLSTNVCVCRAQQRLFLSGKANCPPLCVHLQFLVCTSAPCACRPRALQTSARAPTCWVAQPPFRLGNKQSLQAAQNPPARACAISVVSQLPPTTLLPVACICCACAIAPVKHTAPSNVAGFTCDADNIGVLWAAGQWSTRNSGL